MYKYNDNELLYLLYEGEDIARQILFGKYNNLIFKRLRAFRIKEKNIEDFYQEGLMALNDAVNTFNPRFKKTFNKYFDLILQRRIIGLLRKEKHYFYNVTLTDDLSGYLEDRPSKYYYETLITSSLNNFEKDVYILRFRKNYRAHEIAKIMDCNIKKVYNTIYAIRIKLQELYHN